ncbi:hypothetical protein ZOSMA_270G00180 [Zostera marina]|uniref:Ornithine aminotransferase n=1 Tax=Zostera marina TaxID=29655 RepID=A0A0K9PGA9_ZOSMR|nr:hypothetical protein ZOSMA_270G00180 [Zostera marina]
MNEAAIKFSRKFQRFTHPDETEPAIEVIAFSNSFHERTMGALALTITIVEYGNIEAVKKIIKKDKIAVVFVELVQGERGIYTTTKEFLQQLRDACDAARALLVYDEVVFLLLVFIDVCC